MRTARQNKEDTGFFRVGEAEEICGLVLGGDYCAEHERGIDPIRQAFGISDQGPPGIGRYQISGLASFDALVFCDRDDLDQSILCFGDVLMLARIAGVPAAQLPGGTAQRFDSFEPKEVDRQAGFPLYWTGEDGRPQFPRAQSKKADREAWKSQNAGIIGAWDDKAFMVRALGSEARRCLGEIFEAFLSCDIAISTSKATTPFGRGGLAISIPSRMDPADLDQIRAQDADQDLLDETFRASGIPALFVPGPQMGQLFGPHARPSYFALMPRWTREYLERREADPTTRPTEADLRIFLNPMNQRYCNFGWFTADDIRRWFDGEGPIVKAWVEQQAVGNLDQSEADEMSLGP